MSKKAKRIRYYGLTKVRKSAKSCWLSMQNKNGWSLGLALKDRTVWLKNIRFATKEDVVSAVNGTAKLVTIALKKSK